MRLKGGDPFVFGRGGEEALVLREAGIPFEVVPGHHRGHRGAGLRRASRSRTASSRAASRSSPATRTRKPERVDWPALAAFPGTLVFYMGVRALPRIAERLVAGGRPPDEPVAVVERGTLPGPADGARDAGRRRRARAGIRAPAITLVGPVAALREQLAWLEARPLHGRTVAVTRARAQASRSPRGCASWAPTSSRRRRSARGRSTSTLPDLRGYDLLCVTSPTGAERLFDHLRDARDLAGVTVAAIGPGTARALRARGVEADVVPERAVAEGLVEALADVPVRRALIARAAEGRDVLPDALRERGAEVDVVALYETVARAARRRGARRRGGRRLRALHVGLVGAVLRRRGRLAERAAAGLDRAGDERGAARARRRAGPGGRPAHAGRPGRGAPGRRRVGRGRIRWKKKKKKKKGGGSPMLADAGSVIVTFLSDYGPGDEYAGVVEGVIARIAPRRA